MGALFKINFLARTQYEKIARAKNTSEEIAFFAKTVGSDYFLEDRRILPDLKKGFNTLFSEFVPHANSVNSASDSHSERDTRIELVSPPCPVKC